MGLRRIAMFRALGPSTPAAGSITNAMLATGIDGAKITDGSLQVQKLQANTITSDKMSTLGYNDTIANAVTAGKSFINGVLYT